MSSFDYELHRNAVVWLRENSVTDLDLPFSVDVMNPWNSKPVTIGLSDDPEKKLLDDNKVGVVKIILKHDGECFLRFPTKCAEKKCHSLRHLKPSDAF